MWLDRMGAVMARAARASSGVGLKSLPSRRSRSGIVMGFGPARAIVTPAGGPGHGGSAREHAPALPLRGVHDLHPEALQLVADPVRFLVILRGAGGGTSVEQPADLRLVDPVLLHHPVAVPLQPGVR